MKNPLRQFFIPSPENGKLPYALHPAAFGAYLICAVAFLVAPAYMNRLQLANLSTPYRAYSVMELVNASRAAMGLPALKESSTLNRVAEAKAKDIFEKQYFSHISPEKRTPWDFLKEFNYPYKAAGENLAIDFVSPEDAHQGLMASPTHRANILSDLYTEIGVAVFEGTFENRPSIVVVQYFGTPRSMIPKRANEKPAPSSPMPKKPMAAVVVSGSNDVSATSSTGTVVEEPAVSRMLSEDIVGFIPETLAQVKGSTFPLVPVASLFILSGILLALTFLLTRKEMISAEVALRAVLFVILFGYLAAFGETAHHLPTVTPAAFSIIY